MRRLYSAIALCVSLLIIQAGLLTVAESSAVDPIEGLLRFPAPPPPNPDIRRPREPIGRLSPNAGQMPDDDAPINELLAYWTELALVDFGEEDLYYRPKMSDVVFQRLSAEVDKDPKKLVELLSKFPRDERSAAFIKNIMDREGSFGAFDEDAREAILDHLVNNSPYYTDQLYTRAARVRDTATYVSNHRDLLKLAKWDFDRARPLLDDLYRNDASKPTRMVAAWAFYLNAIKTGSVGDTERYRDELKAAVENRNLTGPVRDLAMDALVAGGDWSGRDEWYTSLLSDPTLTEIPGYTGLTTLINASEPGKYIDKMIDLLGSSSATVRAAAIRNLAIELRSRDERVIRAMLPWLSDPKWAGNDEYGRMSLVSALVQIKVPESVPGLIAMLDERGTERGNARSVVSMNSNTNSMGSAANAAASAATAAMAAAMRAAMAASGDLDDGFEDHGEEFPFRMSAIMALATQADRQAAPALRRILGEVEEYQTPAVIRAMIKCHAFELHEQIEAIEFVLTERGQNVARMTGRGAANVANQAANAANTAAVSTRRGQISVTRELVTGRLSTSGSRISPAEVQAVLGLHLIEDTAPNDELSRAMVDHIISIDDTDKPRAASLRKAVFSWSNPIFSALHLHDIRRDRGDARDMLKVIADRKSILEKIPSDLFAMTTGTETSAGIAACMLGNWPDQKLILESDSVRTQAAMLACARLVRTPLPITMIEPLMFSNDRVLARAAESYLVSVDTVAARDMVLKKYPGRAMIFGAMSAFWPDDAIDGDDEILSRLFSSIGEDLTFRLGPEAPPEKLVADEKRFQKEVLTDDAVLAVYAYDSNVIRIYEDRVSYTWEEDEARYQTRDLSEFEFNSLRNHLAANNVDEMPPAISCNGIYCVRSELLMIGRNGGRRVFRSGASTSFFAWLDDFFENAKKHPMTTKYALSSEIRGLEIVYADNRFEALTVWNSGNDIRALISDKDARTAIIESAVDPYDLLYETSDDDDEEETETVIKNRIANYEAGVLKAIRERQTKLFATIEWRSVENGKAESAAAQPPEIPFIPALPGSMLDPVFDTWKARAGNVEYRTGDEGLYKVTGGNPTLYKKGKYSSPLVTANGRWLVVTKEDHGEEEENILVRINLANAREYPVTGLGESYSPLARSEIGTTGRVLILEGMYEMSPFGSDPDDEDNPMSGSTRSLGILDTQTGAITPARGEIRPMIHQTFRPLQRTADGATYWAAIPNTDKKTTDIGVYDMRTAAFKRVLHIPKITFDSLAMWVDEAAGTVYFVYRGHIVKLPLDQSKPN